MAEFNEMIDSAMNCCIDVFGEKIQYFPRNSQSEYEMEAIFEESYTSVDTGGEVPVETRQPVLCVRNSEFSRLGIKARQDDIVIINGKTYRVVETQPDGWSETRLILFKKGSKNAGTPGHSR